MNLDPTIVYWLTALHEPAIFLGTVFFGEVIVLTAAFLSGNGMWSVWSVFLFSLAGVLVSDAAWFYFGRRSNRLLQRYTNRLEKYRAYVTYIDNAFERRPWRTMLFLKFLYGTRIIMIVYLSLTPLSLRRFVAADAFATTILLSLVITVGWLAGAGVIHAIPSLANIQYAILILLGIIVVYKLMTLWLSRQIDKSIIRRNKSKQK